jgi:hypothetical protein
MTTPLSGSFLPPDKPLDAASAISVQALSDRKENGQRRSLAEVSGATFDPTANRSGEGRH